MLKYGVIALALLSGTAMAQDMDFEVKLQKAEGNYSACLVQEAMTRGAGNSDPLDAVWKDATAKCEEQGNVLRGIAYLLGGGRRADIAAAGAERDARSVALVALMQGRLAK